MGDLEPRSRLCLGDVVIPLLGPAMFFFRDIDGEEVADQQQFLTLELGGQCFKSMEWLLKALGLECRWWKMHCSEVQLLKEFHQAIDVTRPRKRKQGQRYLTRTSARSHIAVAFMIRGEKVVLINKPLAMAHLIRPGEEEKTIKWLIKEIVPDIKLLIEKPSEIAAAEANEEKEGEKDEEEDPQEAEVDEQLVPAEPRPDLLAVADIQHHFAGDLKKVIWMPSRQSFRVVTNNGRLKEIRPPALSRKLKSAEKHTDFEHAAWTSVREAFAQCKQDISSFLEELPPPVPLADA